MGKGTRGPYVSKGERPSVNKSITKAVKRARHPAVRMLNQLNAHLAGKYTKLSDEATRHTGVHVHKPGAKAQKIKN